MQTSILVHYELTVPRVGLSCNFYDWFESEFSHWGDNRVSILSHGHWGKKKYLKFKKNIRLLENMPDHSFQLGMCVSVNLGECSVHLCDRDIDIEIHMYLINNLLKIHLHSAALHIFVFIRAVNQHWELFRSDLLSSVSKHKEHRIYHIGLPTSIWTNDAGKALRKRQEKKD